MTTLLIVLLILTISNIIWLILDLTLNDGKLCQIPSVILMFIVIIGWGLGALLPIKTEEVKITTPIEIIKSSTKVYVEVDNKSWEYNTINDSTVFYYLIDYNMYGGELYRELKYRIKR